MKLDIIKTIEGLQFSDATAVIQEKYTKEKITELRNVIAIEISKMRIELDRLTKEFKVNILSKKDSPELDSFIEKGNKEISNFIKGYKKSENLLIILSAAIESYPEDIRYVKALKDIKVSSNNIRTPNGNRAKKDRVLKSGKKYTLIKEFTDTGYFTHGKCISVIDENGYQYNTKRHFFEKGEDL